MGVSLFGFDVTERVQASQAVEAQRAELQRLFAQAPVAVCVFRGTDYVLELVNPLMGLMLGHAPAWLVGQPFFQALPELIGQGLREVLDEVRRTGIPFVAQSQPIQLARHGTAEPGYFDFVYQPVRENDVLTGVVCVATDVTEQVLARQQVQALNEELAAINEQLQATNEELNESNTRLLHTNADLDTFVYTASHDLKAPIANIEGLLDVLSEYLPAADQEPLVPQLMERMRGDIARFQQTVGHLTDVSHLHYQSGQPQEEVDVARVMEEVRLDLLPLLEGSPGPVADGRGRLPPPSPRPQRPAQHRLQPAQ